MKLYKRKTDNSNIEKKLAILETNNKNLSHKGKSDTTGNSDVYSFLLSVINFENIGFGIKRSESNILFLSDIARRIAGLMPDTEIEFDDFANLILQEDKQEFLKAFHEKSFQKPCSVEYRIVRSDQEREIRYIASKISYLEDEKRWMFTVSDITKYEKVKKDLIRAKEKTEESDNLKNIFLSNISQEIRVPMNSIVGFAELINIGNLPAEKKDEYIHIIRQQSIQLLKLIDDIAEIAKFEAGEIKINKSPCNLNLLLNELHIYFNQQKKILKKEHIVLKLNLSDTKGIITYTDTGRLQQLLSNLLSNAIKFTEKGFVEFGYNEKDGKIEFYVKDTGIGLSKEEQKFIFNRFRTNEATIIKKYEGSGLGLTIAWGIVKLLGGKIWIESEPGKGSVFYFNIPFERLPKEDKQHFEEELSPTRYNWKGKIILAVEDDNVNYKFLETLLIENQAVVIRAENGLQAVELCKSISKIDLIIMDIKMPQMDGFEATRQIRLINKNIPIIAQTAYVMEEDRQKCLDAGCNDHVTKPIDIVELLRKINNFFRP